MVPALGFRKEITDIKRYKALSKKAENGKPATWQPQSKKAESLALPHLTDNCLASRHSYGAVSFSCCLAKQLIFSTYCYILAQ